jgi:hypothetical protein
MRSSRDNECYMRFGYELMLFVILRTIHEQFSPTHRILQESLKPILILGCRPPSAVSENMRAAPTESDGYFSEVRGVLWRFTDPPLRAAGLG